MKTLLKNTLTERQYGALWTFKNKIVPSFIYRLVQSPFLLVGSIVKVLPDSSLVTLKSGINVVKKMDYEPRDIFLNIESDFEYRVRLHSCKKEPDTVKWIETFMQKGDVFYDIGANTGAYSLVASKFFAGQVKVFAFEPAFLNYTQLCKNLMLNDCQESITPFQVALADETGVESFNLYSLTPGGAVHTVGEAVDFKGERFKPASIQRVLKYSLDDFIQQFQIPVPNHIKIDVDGTEFSVLKGMSDTLDDGSVRSLMLELNEKRGDGGLIIEYLSNRGFQEDSRRGPNRNFVRRDLAAV